MEMQAIERDKMLDWPKNSFGFFCNILQINLDILDNPLFVDHTSDEGLVTKIYKESM